MPNQVSLTFAGDADKLSKETKRAGDNLDSFAGQAKEAGDALADQAAAAEESTDRMAKLANITDGTLGAIEGAAAGFQALADVQDMQRAASVKVERALNDVAQAQQDLNQALGDGKQAAQDATQAGIDYEQAQVDARVALTDHAAAVAEFGAGSAEAAQAQVDLKQAQADAQQATLDQEQALRDGEQALIDAKGATLDLSDANAEANPGDFQRWSDMINTYSPLLSGLVGVLGLVAAAQWVWNAATAASPVVWIIAGIVALVAAIVLIATQTEWFQELWSAAWDWITTAAADAWAFIEQIPGWIQGAFIKVGDFITAPFKAAFNGVADIWNNTIGQLSWTVPDWVPVIGGGTITVPKIPKFHDGGMVGGAPGTEQLALLQAGERVIPAGQAGGGGGGSTVTFHGDTSTAVAAMIMGLIRTGKIQIQATGV